jgi:hypothetical protein
MKLTIIPSDGAVYKDGVAYSGLDLSVVPTNIHALQWYDSEGEVEFNGKPKAQNELITVLPDWVNVCLNKWDEAKAAEEAAIAFAAANQPITNIQTA